MKINITNNTLLSQIQHQFQDAYPFLRLDFYKRSDNKISFLEKIPEQTSVMELGAFTGTKYIDMDSNKTVAQLEQDFLEDLGLTVKIFRQCKDSWVDTSYTKNWTLNGQNRDGEHLSTDEHRYF